MNRDIWQLPILTISPYETSATSLSSLFVALCFNVCHCCLLSVLIVERESACVQPD